MADAISLICFFFRLALLSDGKLNNKVRVRIRRYTVHTCIDKRRITLGGIAFYRPTKSFPFSVILSILGSSALAQPNKDFQKAHKTFLRSSSSSREKSIFTRLTYIFYGPPNNVTMPRITFLHIYSYNIRYS